MKYRIIMQRNNNLKKQRDRILNHISSTNTQQCNVILMELEYPTQRGTNNLELNSFTKAILNNALHIIRLLTFLLKYLIFVRMLQLTGEIVGYAYTHNEQINVKMRFPIRLAITIIHQNENDVFKIAGRNLSPNVSSL